MDLKSKGEVAYILCSSRQWFMDMTIKIIHTDNGMEYVNNSFEEITVKNGIVHQWTVEFKPKQNGIC
jgi:transposase InsO family protein